MEAQLCFLLALSSRNIPNNAGWVF